MFRENDRIEREIDFVLIKQLHVSQAIYARIIIQPQDL